jgi:hypothetical protein
MVDQLGHLSTTECPNDPLFAAAATPLSAVVSEWGEGKTGAREDA